MNDNLKVSIIIPVYNCEKFINKCLNSIIKQSYKNLEVILVNDGSTDNSYAICQKIANTDNRIKVFNKDNGGVSSARNYGLEQSTGDYIFFVDSDDYLELYCLKNCMEIINTYKLDIIKFGIIKEVSKRIKKELSFSVVTNKVIENKYYDDLLYPYAFSTSDLCSVNNAIIKKDIINHKFESKLLGEDFLFFTNCLKKSKNIYFMNKNFYHYVVNESSATHGFNSKRHLEKLIDNIYVENKVFKVLNKEELLDTFIKKVSNDIYNNISIFIINNNYKEFCGYINMVNNNDYLKNELAKIENYFPKNIKQLLNKNKFIYYKIKTKEKIKTTIKKIIIKLFRK